MPKVFLASAPAKALHVATAALPSLSQQFNPQSDDEETQGGAAAELKTSTTEETNTVGTDVPIAVDKLELPALKRIEPVADFTQQVIYTEFVPFEKDSTRLYRLTDSSETVELPPAYKAAMLGDVQWLRNLLEVGVSLTSTTICGDTPLCAAVWNGHADAVRLLLENGADPNCKGRAAQPPIALASLKRNPEVLEALLLFGADPNARFKSPVETYIIDSIAFKDLRSALTTDDGVTPLMACSARGDVEAAVILMQYGGNQLLHTTKKARYAINFASTQGYIFLMRVLLGKSADEEPNLLVTVDLSKQRAWITQSGKIIDSTSISSGRKGFATPAGRYVVTDKHKSWTSTIYKVAMPYFMRLNCSAIGLHQGYVTGSPASHGCVRLPAGKARSFFAKVQVGDEVEIVD